MSLNRTERAVMRFLAGNDGVRRLSPPAFVVYVRLVSVTEEFGALFPGASGADWPADAMLARACGVSLDEFADAVAEMTDVGLYAPDSPGGFVLVLPNAR